jgi:hypothetical protein
MRGTNMEYIISYMVDCVFLVLFISIEVFELLTIVMRLNSMAGGRFSARSPSKRDNKVNTFMPRAGFDTAIPLFQGQYCACVRLRGHRDRHCLIIRLYIS